MSGVLRTLVLEGLPVGVHRRALEHSATIRRELAMLRMTEATGASARLQELAEELGSTYAGFGSGDDPIMGRALASGDAVVTLHYEMPPEAAAIAEHLDRVLDEVDEHSRSGDLVTLVTPPDVLAYRHWFLAEVVGQVRDGAAPTPFPAAMAPAAVPAAPGPRTSAVVVVSDDLDLLGVGPVREEVAAAIEAGATTLTLDVSGCGFVDSVGVSLLVTTLNRLGDDGGHLVLVGVSDALRTTLEHAGVLDLLQPG